MALHTKKLYYRRGGTTYSVDLYTTTAEVGAEYLALRDGSTTVYAKIDAVGSANESFLRIHKSGVTKSLLSTILAASPWLSLTTGLSAAAYDIRPYNGNLIVTGGFSTAGGISAPKAASWNGTSWSVMGSFPKTCLMSTAIYNNELIGSGGSGNSPGVYRWDGSTWVAMGSFNGAYVDHILMYKDELYAAGRFTSSNGTAAYLGKWNGTSWQTVGSANPNGYLRSLSVYNGDLIAVGNFTSIGGVSASRIARWNGTSWTSMSSSTSAQIFSACEYNGNLVVSGSFTRIGGVSAYRVAMWNGSVWSAMGSGLDDTAYFIYCIEGKLYVLGLQTTANGVTARYVSVWDGTAWSALPSQVDALTGGYAYAATEYKGNLIVGGNFTSAGGTTLNNIGALPTGETPALLSYKPGNIHCYPRTGSSIYNIGMGLALNGTLINGVGYSTLNGGTLTFDGTNDYVLVSNNPTKNLTAATIIMWVNPTTWNWSSGPGKYLWGQNNALPGSGGVYAYIGAHSSASGGNGKFEIGVYTTLTPFDFAISTSTVALNTWHHVAASWGPSGTKILVNGGNKGENLIARNNFGSSGINETFGATGTAGSFFNGKIGSCKIIDSVLTDAEIISDFNATKARFGL